jgi:fumarate reductase subunit D
MKQVRVKHVREFAPVVTGILLIALGLVLPLGPTDSPRLIDLFSSWASSVIGLSF